MKRFAALAAFLAITLQALWPLLSHARPRGLSLRVPVCTVDGLTHELEIKTGKSPLDERAAQHGEHCKLCFAGTDRVAVLASPAAGLFFDHGFLAAKITSRPDPLLDPPRHPQARPRAPPQIS